jgi:hypothetical protein
VTFVSIDVDSRRVDAEFVKAAKLSAIGIRAIVATGGEEIKNDWVANARISAGEHGVHYPDAIEANMRFGGFSAIAEIGPNPGKPQGGMSFEYGSVNQPPHLDGKRALDKNLPSIERKLALIGIFT